MISTYTPSSCIIDVGNGFADNIGKVHHPVDDGRNGLGDGFSDGVANQRDGF